MRWTVSKEPKWPWEKKAVFILGGLFILFVTKQHIKDLWQLATLHAEAAPVARPGTGTPDLGPNADLQGKTAFPADNPWNQPIDSAPVDQFSDAIIARIGSDIKLHPDFGANWNGGPFGIPYVVVTGKTPTKPITFDYAAESDAGPYPLPDDAPIEGGPLSDGDRHLIVIDRDHWKAYELWHATHAGKRWTAGSGAIFDMTSNEMRPIGWTSADAAGLPIFPGLVRYDETVLRGAIKHALRFTVVHSRRAYVAPARHFASRDSDPTLPPLGMRVRLKASYDISGFPPQAKVVLQALKTYGMILADNGSNWYISGAPDSRWNDDDLGAIKRVKASDLEVVKMDNIVTE